MLCNMIVRPRPKKVCEVDLELERQKQGSSVRPRVSRCARREMRRRLTPHFFSFSFFLFDFFRNTHPHIPKQKRQIFGGKITDYLVLTNETYASNFPKLPYIQRFIIPYNVLSLSALASNFACLLIRVKEWVRSINNSFANISFYSPAALRQERLEQYPHVSLRQANDRTLGASTRSQRTTRRKTAGLKKILLMRYMSPSPFVICLRQIYWQSGILCFENKLVVLDQKPLSSISDSPKRERRSA